MLEALFGILLISFLILLGLAGVANLIWGGNGG